MDRTNVIIIAAAIVISALVNGGIYEISANERGAANVINKFTGAVWFCYQQECKPMPEPVVFDLSGFETIE